jgi:hypothetical protein
LPFLLDPLRLGQEFGMTVSGFLRQEFRLGLVFLGHQQGSLAGFPGLQQGSGLMFLGHQVGPLPGLRGFHQSLGLMFLGHQVGSLPGLGHLLTLDFPQLSQDRFVSGFGFLIRQLLLTELLSDLSELLLQLQEGLFLLLADLPGLTDCRTR